MRISTLTRAFSFAGVRLPDPDPGLSPDAVKATFSAIYPELTNAVIEGPTERGGELVYEFRKAAGTKG